MKFLDQVKVYIRSGDGGSGAVSFRREKFLEFGGPDGGKGGCGGDVWVKVVDSLNTLIDYRYRPYFYARNGVHGMGYNRTGSKGMDAVLKVPVGTQILEEDNKTLICDLKKVGECYCLARGGNGGFGNLHFTTSANRTPRYANPGLRGEQYIIWLRLKLIADVGLVGMPNAGKSTFLSMVTAAKPKIASYPFTTLYPNLGVVCLDGRELVFVDTPGLTKGAHIGIGLGDRFLGHVERTSILMHLVSACEYDVARAYQTVRGEMEAYGHKLTEKPEIVILSQCDVVSDEERCKKTVDLEKVSGTKVFVLSATQRQGFDKILCTTLSMMERERYL